MCSDESEQFLARISNCDVSGLSESNHIELKSPRKDLMVCFSIWKGSDVKLTGQTIGFQ